MEIVRIITEIEHKGMAKAYALHLPKWDDPSRGVPTEKEIDDILAALKRSLLRVLKKEYANNG